MSQGKATQSPGAPDTQPATARSAVEGKATTPRRRWNLLTRPDRSPQGESGTLSYYVLLTCTVFLLVLGMSMVFSVQSVTTSAMGQNVYGRLARNLGIALVGLMLMVGVSRLPQRLVRAASVPTLLIAMIAQLGVFVPGVRYCAGGNCNWIRIPFIGTGQPSEFIKLGLALYIGWVAVFYRDKLRDFKGTATVLALPAVAAGLVLAGGDLGTLVIIALLLAGGLWIAGLPGRWFVILGSAGVALFGAFSIFSANRRARITAWLNPEGSDPLDVGYQPLHGRYALGTGGLSGVGPGASRQKWGYLTQADSDYIFAVIGEELGLVGTLLVIVLFAAVGWCCVRIMRRSNDRYVSVVTGGIMVWIVGQAVVNMSVVVGLLPVLGVPLPLISAGGTSIIFVLLAIGVLLSFARCEPGAPEAFDARPSAVRRTVALVTSWRRNRG